MRLWDRGSHISDSVGNCLHEVGKGFLVLFRYELFCIGDEC